MNLKKALAAQAALFALECALLFLCSGRPLLWASAHAALALLGSWAFGESMSGRCERRYAALLGWALLFFLPAAGAGAALLIALLTTRWKPPASGLLDEYKEHAVLPQQRSRRLATPVEKRMIDDPRDVEPLVDMLSSQDIDTKRSALEAISRRGNAKLIGHIVKALSDPRPEIYQFAMAQILRLQEEYGKAISKAVEDVRSAPLAVEPRRRLADAYERYLRSGLADKSVEGFYRDRVMEEYRRILQLSPAETEVHRALGRHSLALGRYDDAKASFEDALQLEPKSLDVRSALIETLYEAGEYPQMYRLLTQTAQAFPPEEDEDPPPLAAIRWLLSREGASPR
jgi:tetratricopeptide (TPR) repeat protein